MNELENPVLKDELDGPALRELALQADAEGLSGDTILSAATVETQEPDHVPEQTESNPEIVSDKPRNTQGQFVKRTEEEPVAETAPEKPESDYERAKRERSEKEKKRRDQSWEALNRDKEQFRQQQRQWQEQQQRQRTERPKREFTSRQVWEAHLDFTEDANKLMRQYRETGDDRFLQEFDAKVAQARDAHDAAWRVKQDEDRDAQEAYTFQVDADWQKSVDKQIQSEPDLLDSNSALAKEVLGSLKPRFNYIKLVPNGFSDLVQAVKWKLEAETASGLREQLKKSQQRVSELEKATGLAGGGITTAPSKKAFEDLPIDQMGKELRRMANQAGMLNQL